MPFWCTWMTSSAVVLLGRANLTLLESMLQALEAAGLTLKPSKVQFGPKEVKYIGHILSINGIRIGEDRIKAFVPLVESGICLLVDVATLSTIYDVRHPLLLPPEYPTLRLPFQLLPV